MKQFTFVIRILLFLVLLFVISCNEDSVGPEYTSYDWPVSSPEEQEMDSQLLSQAFTAANNIGYVDCILIIRNGYIVGERYFNNYNKNTAHNVKSVSKSFLSALAGIALRDEHLNSLNSKMLDFFPEYIHRSIDPRKHDITIRHLLMMRMGIDHERNNYEQIYNTPNWLKTTIELPLLYDPGIKFSYNTFQTHLLSAIMTMVSNQSTLEFAREKLLHPINIDVAEWQQCPQGYYFGGNNMYFTPRNMARLGYLYMHDGLLEGNQIVPANWVQASLTNYTNFSNSNWGNLHNVNYGYLWWLGEINTHDVFLAIGYGGQFVINFPELNLIVVTTAESNLDWDTADRHERYILKIVADYIEPAIQD
ncbi:MAG: serine hydrolase [Ignavibacteriaceae bacterium]|nr:serine hydrolase [Ignavibacteriaceae bacterium]